MPPRAADAEAAKSGRDPFAGWRPRSLRARQLLAASVGLVAFLFLAGYALDKAFVSTAEQNMRHRLKGYAMSYANKVEFARDGSLIPPELPVDPRFTQPGSGLYAEVRLPNARWGSDSTLGPGMQEVPMLAPLQEVFTGPVPITQVDGSEGTVYRFGLGTVYANRGPDAEFPYSIYVSEDSKVLVSQLRTFRGALWVYL